MVGKYIELPDAYKSLAEALSHGGIANNVSVKLLWLDAEIFESENAVHRLADVDGILVPGGFGERGAEGKVAAVKFARQHEVPFFGIGTANIGDRQMGRETPNSVINCEFNENSIVYSINKILNTNFKKRLKKRVKKYENKNTAKKIAEKLYFFNFKKYNKKLFYDL